MLKLAIYTAVILTGAQAAAVCQWTVQRSEDFFAQQLQYLQKPKIEKTVCRTGTPPICTGYIYCPPAGRAAAGEEPKAQAVACKSVAGPAGKWRCPDAQTCYDDADITMDHLGTPPSSEYPGEPAAETASPPGTVTK